MKMGRLELATIHLAIQLKLRPRHIYLFLKFYSPQHFSFNSPRFACEAMVVRKFDHELNGAVEFTK